MRNANGISPPEVSFMKNAYGIFLPGVSFMKNAYRISLAGVLFVRNTQWTRTELKKSDGLGTRRKKAE
ncbi:MAG: hypothetical protein LBK82_12920 [Planctomycetaceae bacterium]|nr:hypothetical protein [Planctomycetaceae bacterium]